MEVSILFKLIQNEWMKLWQKKATWIMLIIVVASVVILLIGSKWISALDNDKSTWQEQQQTAIKDLQKEIDSGDYNESPPILKNIEDEITLAQYRLDHNLKPVTSNTTASFVNNGLNLTLFITLFSIIVAAGIVSFEFSSGTIKMLLTRPINRWKILLSKLLTSIIYSIAMGALLYVLIIGLGYIFFDSSAVNLEFSKGAIVETNLFTHSLTTFGLSYADIITSVLFAFMLGTLFNSSSLAIGFSLVITLMASTIVGLLYKYEFIKYFWFSVYDLKSIIDETYLIPDITIPFALTIICIYSALFIAISFVKFTKQDIKA